MSDKGLGHVVQYNSEVHQEDNQHSICRVFTPIGACTMLLGVVCSSYKGLLHSQG